MLLLGNYSISSKGTFLSPSTKRRIAALAVATVTALLFTGCASSTEPASEPATSPTGTVTETTPATTEEAVEEAAVAEAGSTISLGGWDVVISPFERGQDDAWTAVWADYDEDFRQESAVPDGYEAVKYTITVTRTADTPEINGAINALMVGPNGEESYTATTDYEEATVQPGETNSIWMIEVHPIELLDAGGFVYNVELLNADTFAVEDIRYVAAQ